MSITGDQYLVKKINKSIILEKIKHKHPISRAKISEITGLNKGTVSSLVKELIEEEFVHEIGHGKSSGGRRPMLLLYNHRGGFAIGVDLNVNYLLIVLTDLSGNVIKEQKIYLSDLSLSFITQKMITAIRQMIDYAPKSRHGIVGIGIGFPGITNQHGTILFAPHLKWKNINLKEIIASEFQIPVVAYNESQAGAIGEHLLGAGKGISHLVYVSVGIGIGTGLIFNNQLYKGSSNHAGEMGHLIIETNGKRCRCGNRGCWEGYASEIALLEHAKDLSVYPSLTPEKLHINTFIELADKGDTEVIHLLSQIGEYLGIGLSNIINALNPELIIIGNRFAKAEKWIANPIKQVISHRALPSHLKKVSIRFAKLGLYSTSLGAALLAINHFFSDMNVSVK
jgi:predicted NBD/HSP70 family sugar kinase